MEAFLETSVMIDLLFRGGRRRTVVLEALRAYESTCSSEYVKMEIKRGALNNYVLLYNKTIELANISDVGEYVARFASGPKRNTLGTMLGAMNDFQRAAETGLGRKFGEGPASKNGTKILASFLRLRILGFWKAFERALNRIVNDVECYTNIYRLPPPYLKKETEIIDNKLQNCDHYKPGICRIGEFLSKNAEPYHAIRLALEKIDKPDGETSKRVSSIRRTFRRLDRMVLRKQCWEIGDGVIVVECPPSACLLTKNEKHFAPMCKALGRAFEIVRDKA